MQESLQYKCRCDAIIWRCEQRYPKIWCEYRKAIGKPYPVWYLEEDQNNEVTPKADSAATVLPPMPTRPVPMSYEEAFDTSNAVVTDPWTGIDAPAEEVTGDDSAYLIKYKDEPRLSVEELRECPSHNLLREWEPRGMEKFPEPIPKNIRLYTDDEFLEEVAETYGYLDKVPWDKLVSVFMNHTEDMRGLDFKENPTVRMSKESIYA